MAAKRVTVGTTPVQIALPNDNRIGISIEMIPASEESANTGIVHISKDGAPSITSGDPVAGQVLQESDVFQDRQNFKDDPSVYNGAWWAIADTAGQILSVDDLASN